MGRRVERPAEPPSRCYSAKQRFAAKHEHTRAKNHSPPDSLKKRQATPTPTQCSPMTFLTWTFVTPVRRPHPRVPQSRAARLCPQARPSLRSDRGTHHCGGPVSVRLPSPRQRFSPASGGRSIHQADRIETTPSHPQITQICQISRTEELFSFLIFLNLRNLRMALLAVSVHPMQLTPGAPARPVYHDCPVRWTRLRPDHSRIPASGRSGGGV